MAKRDYTQEIATALRAGFYQNLSFKLPDPDPILAKLGHRQEIYAQILADAKVCACVEQRKAGCLSMLWDIKGDEASADAIEIIRQAMQRLGMPSLISEILNAVLWGFQPLEVMWEVRGGLTLPARVIGKPAHWFCFSADNELRFLSVDHPDGEELRDRKFLLAQHNATYINPYGEKLLPKCFWPVMFKKGAWKWWVTATEKFGSPFILGKVPRGTDQTEIAKLDESLQALIQDVTAVIPNDTAVEIMDGQSGSSASAPHRELIEQCNAEIALAILGQTLTTEVGSTGSYAASKTHNDVRADIIAGDKRMVEETLQTLVDWIYELNWSGSTPPKFSMWDEEDVDKALAERDKILTETGLKFTKSYYIKSYGLAEDDFEITEPQESQGAAFAEAPAKAHLTGVKRPFNAYTYQLDGAKISDFGKALIAVVDRLIDEGQGYEDVRQSIETAYPQLPTDEMEEALARAFYVAAIEGRL
ncbi:DUF935 family protein [bacterium]|nr:DUF935 family protein [bacterium]